MSLRRSRVRKLWLGIVALAGLVAVAASCDAPAERQLPPLPDPQAGVLHVIQAVPDAAALDIYLDGNKLVSALAYRKSSGNLTTPPGLHKLEVRLAGLDATAMPLWSDAIFLQAGQKLLLTAVGRVADSDAATAVRIVATPFGLSDAAAVHVRLLNAAPSEPALDMTTGTDTLASGVPFGSVGATAVPSWTLNSPTDLMLSLAATGQTASLATGLGQAALSQTFSGGSVLTFVAFGEENPLFDDTHFFGLSLFDEAAGTLTDLPFTLNGSGAMASLYIYQASSDTQAIDIYAENGARLIGGLAYDSVSTLLTIPPGAYNIEVRSSASGTVLERAMLKLVPSKPWALFLSGLHGTAPPGRGLTLYAAPIESKTSGKRWRVIHTILDADAVTVSSNGSTLLGPIDYAQAAPYRTDPLPSGTLQLNLVADATRIWNIVVPQAIADSVRDEVTTIYLTGSSTNPAQPLLAVALVESSATTMRAPTLMPLSTTK